MEPFCPFFPILQFLDPTVSVLPCFRHITTARTLPPFPALFFCFQISLISSQSVGPWHNSAHLRTLTNSLHQNLILVWLPILSVTHPSPSPHAHLSCPLDPFLPSWPCPLGARTLLCPNAIFLHSISPAHKEN